MAEALDLAIRTRDRHLAFLPKPKLLVRQVVSRDLVDDGRAEDLPEEAEPDGFADLMDQIHCTLRGYQDNSRGINLGLGRLGIPQGKSRTPFVGSVAIQAIFLETVPSIDVGCQNGSGRKWKTTASV